MIIQSISVFGVGVNLVGVRKDVLESMLVNILNKSKWQTMLKNLIQLYSTVQQVVEKATLF